jgi:hypothetical protein
MNEFYVAIALQVLAVVFSAGMWFATDRRSQKDVNGVGKKINDLAQLSDARYLRLALALLSVCNEEQRAQIARQLGEKPSEQPD